jgi:phage gpG-like protein
MSVRKTGDWALARRILAEGAAKLRGSIGTAMRQEAELLRGEIVNGITAQAPGGEAFKPLSPLTLAARKLAGFGGTKALLVSGDLRNSIAAIVRGDEAFVGVPRKARSKDGRSLVDVAQVQEFGSNPIVIPITPRMRRFLFALLRQAGKEPSGGSGKGVVVVTIPARPFLRPAFKKFSEGAQRRFLGRVAAQLGWGGA